MIKPDTGVQFEKQFSILSNVPNQIEESKKNKA